MMRYIFSLLIIFVLATTNCYAFSSNKPSEETDKLQKQQSLDESLGAVEGGLSEETDPLQVDERLTYATQPRKGFQQEVTDGGFNTN